MKTFFTPCVRLVLVLSILLVALYVFSDMFQKVPVEIFTAVLALFFVPVKKNRCNNPIPVLAIRTGINRLRKNDGTRNGAGN